MGKHLSQIQLFADIAKAIERQGFKNATIKQLNAIAECATLLVKKFHEEHIPAVPGMGLDAWAKTDDVGASSKYIATVLTGGGYGRATVEVLKGKAYPLDADDFGRCYKLLKAVPEFDGRMGEVAAVGGAVWVALVENWETLEILYEQDIAEKDLCSLKIHELISSAKNKS